MARASRAEALKHRGEIVEAASQLFRARGLDGVSVPDLMAAAGLTHGGFYGHFPSKEALAAVALSGAFREIAGRIDGIAAKAGSPAEARDALIDDYLSPGHRDHPELGCPTAALVDIARDSAGETVRSAYGEGIEAMLDSLIAMQEPGKGARDAAIAMMSTLVGALLLSRATRGTALSDAFLAASASALKTPTQD